MKIAIDYHLVTRNPKSGMGVYISEMVKELRKNSKIKIDLLDIKIGKSNSFFGNLSGLLKEQIWVQLQIPSTCRASKIDVLYFPNPPAPFLTGIPVVLTIPDMSFYFDTSFNFFIKAYLYVTYFLSAHRAKFITTFSENSRNDIVRLLKVKREKISIITPSLKDGFLKRKSKRGAKSVFDKFNINSDFFLTVPGTYIPRKNMTDVVKAFKLLPKEYQSKLAVVSVGRMGDGYFDEFKKYCKNENFLNRIIFLSNISDDDLAVLYKEAKMLLFPSLYEGFGLPPLEALAAGTPVAVYNNSSLPEIVGNSAFIVNNFGELGDVMLKIVSKKISMKSKQKLGYKKAREYSIDKSANKLSEVFSRANL